MSWNVISRDSLDLSQYTFLPFGRFNEAMPFLMDWVDSGNESSDLIAFDPSNVGKLKRAIVKLSGVKIEKRDTGKLNKKGAAITVDVYDSATVAKACNKLGIALETIAANNAEGKLTREFVSLKKVAA